MGRRIKLSQEVKKALGIMNGNPFLLDCQINSRLVAKFIIDTGVMV